MRTRLALGIAVVSLVATGCSGIPRSSRPTSVQSVGVEQPAGGEVPPPSRTADPRTIVLGFLNANGVTHPARDGADQFLTKQAQAHWDSSTATIVDNLHVESFSADTKTTGKVEVVGTEIGTIDHNGIYTPGLTGDGYGNGGQPVTFTYGLQSAGGQWRINTLSPNGLLLTAAQFDTYRQHPIYFFDAAGQHLVPDARWTPQYDPTDLAQFLIRQLAAGPRDELQADETTELPAQSNPAAVTVTTVDNGPNGGLTKIEVPQASQLGKVSLDQLAAQIAQTLVAQVSGVDQMEITDNQEPVSIPSAHGPVFTADVVTAPYLLSPNPVLLFYLNDGGVVEVDASGNAEPLPGRIGNGYFGLDSAAIKTSSAGKGLLVVATRKSRSQLDIGSIADGGQMTLADLPPGPLSRPDWVPGMNEAWVGDGSKLYRVQANGKVAQISVTEPSGIATAQISAVRLSPEGSRVAFVLTNAAHSAQIWIGAVVRTSGQVRVDSLTPISPQGVDVADVAWNDELKLFAVGKNIGSGAPNVYEVQVDGSLWTADGIANLPPAPDSITASQGLVAAVSAGGTIWEQLGSEWVSPKAQGGDARGTSPIYSTS